MAPPRFSFVMAAYEAGTTIEAAVRSLLEQRTASPFEVVVVDDGSTDGTAKRLHAVRDDRLRVVRLEHNVGRAAARNEGARVAGGEWIVIADADDVSQPDRLDRHEETIDSFPAAVLVGGQLHEEAVAGRRAAARLTFPTSTEGIDHRFARGRMGVAHPAAAFRRDWFERTGGYDPTLRWAEDYDLFARGWAPGRFAGTAAAVIRYRRPHVRTPWPYWWENERHLAAINARLADGGRDSALDRSIAPYLDAASTSRARLRERVRRIAVLTRDAARG